MENQKVSTCLWFDQQAEEAVKYYTSVFKNSNTGKTTRYSKEGYEIHGMTEGTVMTADFELEGYKFTALNGGPLFHFNPSLSFFVVCESASEVDELWSQLIEGGEAMMPLDSYEWSARYGWLSDRFGISWQLMLGKLEDVGQKITPLLFFTGSKRGKAEEALQFYLDLFPNSKPEGILKYEPGEPGPEGMVKYAQCKLLGQTFMVMDSGVENDFPFNEAISLVISCSTQDEVDYFWEMFLANGGTEQQCGWIKDRFGVVWQVVPEELGALIDHPEKEIRENVTKTMLQMKKLDIGALKKAAQI